MKPGWHILRTALRSLCRSALVVFAAYTFGYLLLCALPAPEVANLGYAAADTAAAARFRLESGVPSTVLEAWGNVLRMDLGLTLDRRPVATELLNGVRLSAGLLMASTAFAVAGLILGGLVGMTSGPPGPRVFRFVAFLPAYLPAYVAAGLMPLAGSVGDGEGLPLAGVAILVALIPGALLAQTVAASVLAARSASYHRTLLAYGLPAWSRLRLITPTVVRELARMIARVLVGLVMVQVFVEAILGMPGMGSSLLQGLRRTDVNLVLGAILVVATLHAVVARAAEVLDWVMFRDSR